MSSNRLAAADIRSGVLDPLRLTREQIGQLSGESRARCGGTDGLRADGMAHTRSGPRGRRSPGLARDGLPPPRRHRGRLVSFDALTGWEEAMEEVTPWDPGATPRPGLRPAWEAGCAPVVRVKGVEVVSLSEVLAAHTIDVLAEGGHELGPVLINVPRHCVEVLVPLGSAADWPPHRYTTCAAVALMRCPAPEVTRASGRWVADRTWSRSPGTIPATTSAVALAEAVPEALLRWHDALRGRSEGWADDRPTPARNRKERP